MTTLGRYVDSLIQSFEDCRSGLTEDRAKTCEGVESYFTELYEREAPRLKEAVRAAQPQLSDKALEIYEHEVDQLIRRVVIPAYARVAKDFTPKERNDFYLTEEKLHLLERVGWGLGGILVGAFVIWAPFIPLWDKELIIPFMLAGLAFPNIRRYFKLRSYEKELNRLVSKTDHELGRIDLAYLTSGEAMPEIAELEKSGEDVELKKKLAALQGNKEGG
jgi:hypothetical protein